MCHIASLLSVYHALLSLFLHSSSSLIPFLSLYSPFLSSNNTSTSLLLYYSNFFLINHTSPHSSLPPPLQPNALFLFECFIFTRILSPSIPMTLCQSGQNYYSWREHRLSGAVLCFLDIIHLWSIPFCGEPSSYSPVMIRVLATLCICTVI